MSLAHLRHPCGRCAPARGRNDRRLRTASSVARVPERGARAARAARASASASRVPCRNSIGICTSNRCLPRSSDGLPAGCSGKPRKARPRTPGSGDAACACEVMRPPNDLPPAMSGSARQAAARPRPPRRGPRPARASADRAACCPLHVGELVAQRRDAALREPVRDRRHERMRHAGAGAVRQHVAGARPRRRQQQAGDAYRVATIAMLTGCVAVRRWRTQHLSRDRRPTEAHVSGSQAWKLRAAGTR